MSTPAPPPGYYRAAEVAEMLHCSEWWIKEQARKGRIPYSWIGGSYLFMDGAELMLDVRSTFFYYATGITPAMADAKPGTGSAYAASFRDKDGN